MKVQENSPYQSGVLIYTVTIHRITQQPSLEETFKGLAFCGKENFDDIFWQPATLNLVNLLWWKLLGKRRIENIPRFSVVAHRFLAQLGLPFFLWLLSLGIFTISLWCPVFRHCLNSTSVQGTCSPPASPMSTAALCAPTCNIFT